MPESYGQLHTVLFPAADAPRRGDFSAPSGAWAGSKAARGALDLEPITFIDVGLLQYIRSLILSETGRELNFFWGWPLNYIYITINYNKKNKL
jgi:hypothetical protein